MSRVTLTSFVAAPHGLGERQLEIDAQIRAARLAPADLGAPPKKSPNRSPNAEKMSSTFEKPAPGTATAAALEAVEAEAIVERALLVVGQDLVGVRRLLELLLGGLVVADSCPGWYCCARRRYAFFRSAWLAPRSTPSTS